jgi:hypothetical protein
VTFIEARNDIIAGLADDLGLNIVLADQVSPETALPFGYYNVISPYIPQSMGGYSRKVIDNDLSYTRTEMPEAGLSFTFVSANREVAGGYVYGEDEALRVAYNARGWFQHGGIPYLQKSGIAVVRLDNFASRSLLVVDETSRRWGFDVTIRYTLTDTRRDGAIEKYALLKGEYTKNA